MNDHDDLALKRALDALPREVEMPGDDLWPSIRSQLQRHQDTRRYPDVRLLRVAALLALLGGSASVLAVTRHRAGIWQVAELAGTARRFAVGERMLGAARFTVGTIGEVDVDTGTTVQLLAARWSEHRLALSRGTLHARINAPPRLFIVETPTGTAIDLGCAYTLEVDSSGNSALRVTAGWVEFTERGHTSIIPEGFHARANRGTGVGLPVADDAPVALAAAAHAVDVNAMNADSAISIIVRNARSRDAVTLWHLLSGQRGSAGAQRAVYARLAAIVPPPVPQADSTAVRPSDMTMRLWWEQLPGAMPIVAGWQRALYMKALKARYFLN